ncbi:MAG: lipoprotein-attachment site-containing protein [Glomeribacter sp. 1016415]|nr:lipoprotein-attachment site-containing protein [Glomeribacter sp. 1016415]
MQIICKAGAIVTLLAALAACGQRGSLYLPTVPPLPESAARPQSSPPENRPSPAPVKTTPASSSGH